MTGVNIAHFLYEERRDALSKEIADTRYNFFNKHNSRFTNSVLIENNSLISKHVIKNTKNTLLK